MLYTLGFHRAMSENQLAYVKMETDPTTTLLDCLQSRDLGAQYSELRKSLDKKHDPAIESWIKEHLQPETLLTKHELALYSALEESSENEVSSSLQLLPVQKGLHEQEILKAVEDLQRSTKAIEKETEKLRTLHESVESIIRSDKKQKESRESAQAIQHRAWVTENSQTRSAIDELSQSLIYQIAEFESKCNNTDVKIRARASELLNLDNRYLTGLQKLANGLVLGELDEDGELNQIRDLCARLIKYVVEGVRAHLDRVYLEAICDGQSVQDRISNENDPSVDALRNELESLYTEILPVAQMSVEQQYLERALRLTTSQDIQESERTEKALDYMSNVITVLIGQIQDFASHTEEYQMYRTTVNSIIKAVRAELDSESSLSLPLKPESPPRTRKLAKSVSPIHSRTQRRRSSGTFLDEESAPELQLLRNLGISLPVDQSGDGILTAHLQAALEDRIVKLNVHHKSLQEASETSIGCHLHDAQITSTILRQSLLSETRFKTVRLLDADVQEAVGMLESDVENLKSSVGGVKLDVLKERDVRRDKLVKRWER